ncbi:hypothetical protein RGL50_005220 [Vibrio alginolyticus]|nr:hypothetical protein [Vibrio alginolyticus]
MSTTTIEETLHSVFSNVNDWLKFAEQKNAALLVLNGGVVWGVTRVISKLEQLTELTYWLMLCGYALIVVSALICLISFLPVLTEKWFKPEERKPADNCLYFADIAKYDNNHYVQLLASKLGKPDYIPNNYELDLSSQIVTNSEIAFDKYKRFRLASIVTIIGVLLFSLAIGTHYF